MSTEELPLKKIAIEIRRLRFQYPTGELVLSIEELDVEHGSVLSILGPSGCGKTTLLNVLGGVLAPSNGTHVRVHGVSVRDARENGLLMLCAQNPVLMPWLTAIENTALPKSLRGTFVPVRQSIDALNSVSLGSEAQRSFPRELSSGMRSRVSVAQALVSGASVLLMDEVFGTLDEATRGRMNIMLREINVSEIGATIVFVTHSIEEAVLLGDRVIVLRRLLGQGNSIIYDTEIKLENREMSVRYTEAFLEIKNSLEKVILKESSE